MKVALTIWDGRISPVFDVSREALVLTVDNGAVVARASESIETPATALKIDRLICLDVETLVCGAISEPLYHDLVARGVTVFAFVSGEIDEVVTTLLAGALPSDLLCMPGCRGRRNRFRGQCAGRGNGWRQRRRGND